MSNNQSDDNFFANILRLLFLAPIIIVFLCTGKCEGPVTACNELKQIIGGKKGSVNQTPDIPTVTIKPGQYTISTNFGNSINEPKNAVTLSPHGLTQGQQLTETSAGGANFGKVNTIKPDKKVGVVPKRKIDNPFNKFGISGQVSNQLSVPTISTVESKNTSVQPMDKYVPTMKTFPTNESEKMGFKK